MLPTSSGIGAEVVLAGSWAIGVCATATTRAPSRGTRRLSSAGALHPSRMSRSAAIDEPEKVAHMGRVSISASASRMRVALGDLDQMNSRIFVNISDYYLMRVITNAKRAVPAKMIAKDGWARDENNWPRARLQPPPIHAARGTSRRTHWKGEARGSLK